MNYKSKVTDDRCTINLIGNFGFDDHPTFREILGIIQAEKVPELTFELSKLKTMDAAATAMLLIAWKQANHHNLTITLSKPSKSVLKTLLEAKLDTLFNIVE